ncbi:hypothetical protein GCM10010187_12930 [Actinomadura coerulea]|nr:hypothetical protein GCM10010187_12930 [Actinomadura coerulea]
MIAAGAVWLACAHLVAFRGLRRAEVAGLAWADTDLQGAGTLTVRETRPGSISVLLGWRAVQERERSAAGPEVWVDSGRVFTREDGARLRPQWISTRFEDLIKKYGLVQASTTSDTEPRRSPCSATST